MRRRSSLGISGLSECEVEEEEQRQDCEEPRQIIEEPREASEELDCKMYGLGRTKEYDKELVRINISSKRF